jgi:DNA-binding IclR family transcriptional regulator
VHGIVATLAARGLVEQDGSGRYALGPGVLRLSNVYLDSNELRLRSLTWTDALAERTGCAVRVGVPLDGDIVVVHHVLRPDGSHQMREVGIDIPAHGTALGKAVLAFDPRREAELLDRLPLPKLTGRTIVDPERLAAQLEQVREGGLATRQRRGDPRGVGAGRADLRRRGRGRRRRRGRARQLRGGRRPRDRRRGPAHRGEHLPRARGHRLATAGATRT